MDTTHYLSRHIRGVLAEMIEDTALILIHGPRQCGKSTLALRATPENVYHYVTFDDSEQRDSAVSDPDGYVAALPAYVILDEIQRVPQIFIALKAAIDRQRTPGRFILTGSCNILLLPQLADSLAGRMEVLRLHPFSQSEIHCRPSAFFDQLFNGGFVSNRAAKRLGDELASIIVTGGYPPVHARTQPHRQAAWYTGYVNSLIQRDIQELGHIQKLDAIPRLLAAVAANTAQLLNVSDLAAPFQISRPTIREYLTLLEGIFLVDTLQPWHSNRLSRLIKTPKMHICDSGLACALLGINAQHLRKDRHLLERMLETFVFQELRRMESALPDQHRFFHMRNKDGVEVDIIIEGAGQRIAGIEIKAATTVNSNDFKGLRKLQDSCGEQFVHGVVLYDGVSVLPFGKNLTAVPIRQLWEAGLLVTHETQPS